MSRLQPLATAVEIRPLTAAHDREASALLADAFIRDPEVDRYLAGGCTRREALEDALQERIPEVRTDGETYGAFLGSRLVGAGVAWPVAGFSAGGKTHSRPVMDAALAVHPDLRGRGVGSALIQRMLKDADERQLSSAVATLDPRNPPLYERFGFKVVAEESRANGVTEWTLTRDPARRA